MIYFKKILGYVFLIIIWTLSYYIINNPIILPSIWQVIVRTVELFKTGEILSPLLSSLYRVFIAILISVILGTLFSMLSYKFNLRDFFSPLMSILKSTPVVSLVLIILFFSNSQSLSSIVVILIITPIVYANILNGLDNILQERLELAWVYNLNFWTKFRYIELPIIINRILFSMVVCVGIALKAAVTAEVIAGGSKGLGSMLYMSKISFEMVDLLSVTLIIVLFSYIIEEVFKILLRKWCKYD